MNNNCWTNDLWSILWINDDEIKIVGPNWQEAYIDGGDFESILSGLCAAYARGREHA